MVINENCIHDILEYLSTHINIEYKDGKSFYKPVSVFELIENFSAIYEPGDIIYTVNLLSQGHYIYGIELQNTNISVSKQKIFYITYTGQKFYTTIQPEPIWNKTKSVLKQVGVHSLEFIEKVAHDVAVESAKQAISIIMSQQYTQ